LTVPAIAAELSSFMAVDSRERAYQHGHPKTA